MEEILTLLDNLRAEAVTDLWSSLRREPSLRSFPTVRGHVSFCSSPAVSPCRL